MHYSLIAWLVDTFIVIRPKCGYRADRDASAAINIILHYMIIHNIHV